jgi:hypothetical protein
MVSRSHSILSKQMCPTDLLYLVTDIMMHDLRLAPNVYPVLLFSRIRVARRDIMHSKSLARARDITASYQTALVSEADF